MPERFDNLLSDAVETAGRAAHAPGAAAARARGRRLRNQRRVTAAALSLTLLAGVSTAAVTLGGRLGGSTDTATVASSGPTASSSPRFTPSTIPSGTSASPSRSSSTGTTPSGSQSPTNVPQPGTVVAAAWLSAGQMPFGTGYQGSWQVSTDTEGTMLGDSVYRESAPMALCSEDIGTAPSTALSKGLTGDQFKVFTGQGILVTGQAVAAYPSQETLFYPSSAAAKSAWNELPVAFSVCKKQITGTNPTTGLYLTGSVQQTLDEGDAACWSTLTTPPSSIQNAHGQVMHACFVRSGSLITVVTIQVHDDDSFSEVGFGSIDSATISALRQALSAYGPAS